MKYCALFGLPVVCGLGVLVGYLTFMDTDYFSGFFLVERFFSRLIAISGGVIAASAFGKGEPARRAWICIAISMLVFIVLDAVPSIGLQPGETFASSSVARGLIGSTSNVLYVIGVWLLVRTWRLVGLELQGSRSARWAVVAVVIILIGLIIGPAVRADFGNFVHGDFEAIFGVIANLADGLTLVLVAPLLLAAVSLRGGLLSWPYLFLTVGQLFWLLLDGLLFSGPGLGFSDLTIKIGGEVLRCLASASLLSAGLAQRLVVKHVDSNPTSLRVMADLHQNHELIG